MAESFAVTTFHGQNRQARKVPYPTWTVLLSANLADPKPTVPGGKELYHYNELAQNRTDQPLFGAAPERSENVFRFYGATAPLKACCRLLHAVTCVERTLVCQRFLTHWSTGKTTLSNDGALLMVTTNTRLGEAPRVFSTKTAVRQGRQPDREQGP